MVPLGSAGGVIIMPPLPLVPLLGLVVPLPVPLPPGTPPAHGGGSFILYRLFIYHMLYGCVSPVLNSKHV